MRFSSIKGLALQASAVVAQLSTYSPNSDISYAVNIPSASAKSGSGDIYIQIKGPVSGSNARSWIAIGQAKSASSQMVSSNIFIVYPGSNGKNITLSPRLGAGFYEPEYTTNTKAELLPDSGIENGILTANIKCSSCNSWSGGQMSFTDSSSNWIWSSATYGPVNSDDVQQDLSMHSQRGTFKFDLTKAAGGSSTDPFAAASSTASTSTSSGDSGSSGASSDSGESSMLPMITTAHASVMSLSFLFFYPLGAIIMRIGCGASTMWVHAALQGFAWLLAIAGLGLGVWMANTLSYLQSAHAIIGLVVVSLLVLQAPLGLMHHFFYKKKGGRTAVSYVHIWYGRALITLGAINGGLGLQLAGNENPSGTIAYGVIAGIIYIGYFALIAATFGKGKKSAARNAAAQEHKTERGSQAS